MKINAVGKTDVGLVRDNNEDSFCVDLEKGIFIVCDGIGGELAGEVASATAVNETLNYLEENEKYFQDCRKGKYKDEDVFRFFANGIRQA